MSFRLPRLSFLVILLFLASLGATVPSEPHRVFGQVNSTSGQPLDSTVSFRSQGSEIKSVETGSDGYYDVNIPNGDYQEDLEIYVNGEVRRKLEFMAFGVSEKNFKISVSEENEKNNSDKEEGQTGIPSLPSSNPNETVNNTEGNDTEAEDTKGLNKSVNATSNSSQILKFEKDIGNVTKGQKINVTFDNSGEESEGSQEDGRKSNENTISSISFTSSSDNEKGSVNISEMSDKEFSESSGIESPEGNIVRVAQVETNIEARNASFRFRLGTSEIEKRNASPENVVQQRYSNGTWQELRTEYLGRSNNSHKFASYSPNGFSYFAITISTDDGQTQVPEKKGLDLQIIAILAFLLAAITAVSVKYVNTSEFVEIFESS